MSAILWPDRLNILSLNLTAKNVSEYVLGETLVVFSIQSTNRRITTALV